MLPPSQQFPLFDSTFAKVPKMSSPANGVVDVTESFVSSVRFNTSTFGIVDNPELFESVTASNAGVEGAPLP
jgi:hypothetical protein